VDILGIGPLELVLILVIALLVFGPDKLPEIGAKLGKGVRELRQLSREISQGVNTITEPMDELRKPFDDASQVVDQVSAGAAALRNPAQVLQNSLEKQLAAPSAEPAAAVQTAAVQTAEDNTIAPPRSTESVEPAAPVAALAVTSSATESIQPAAPAVQPSAAPALEVAVERLDVDTPEDAEANSIAPHLPGLVEPLAPAPQPSTAPTPVAAVDALDAMATDAVADLPTTESAAQTSER